MPNAHGQQIHNIQDESPNKFSPFFPYNSNSIETLIFFNFKMHLNTI